MVKENKINVLKETHIIIAWICVFLAGFSAMAFLVLQSRGIPEIDILIRDAIIGLRSGGLTSVMRAITYMGNTNTIILWCVILLAFSRTRMEYGLAVSLGSVMSATVQTLIKHWVQRPRPDIDQFLITQGGYSFPSGHSCTGLMFYGFLIYLINVNMKNRKLAKELSLLFSILIVAIGFSRVYLGVHYPTDVIGGWCLGAGILMAAVDIHKKIEKRKGRKACQE